jgi:hypothetical protein
MKETSASLINNMQAYVGMSGANWQTKARSWVFTLNNPLQEEIERIQQLRHQEANIRGIYAGYERGKRLDTPHVQGFITFTGCTTRKHVSKLLGSRAYVEAKYKGATKKQAIKYCLKDGEILVAWPELPEEREKHEIQTKQMSKQQAEVRQFLETLRTETERTEVEDAYPTLALRNYQYVDRETSKNKLKRLRIWGGDLRAKNLWLWGEPGSGKTRWAYENRGPGAVYSKAQSKWWDGFDPSHHTIVLIDEFSPEVKGLTNMMKQWADRYPCIQQCKGSHTAIAPGTFNVIVTSNYPIAECFHPTDVAAIQRRFTEIHMTKGTILPFTTIDDSILQDWNTMTNQEPTIEDEQEDAMIQVQEEENEEIDDKTTDAFWDENKELLEELEERFQWNAEHHLDPKEDELP